MGGAFEAVETLKSRLVTSMAARTRRIESGEQIVVGVNDFVETAESPLGGDGAILKVDPAIERRLVGRDRRVAFERAIRPPSTQRSTICAGPPNRATT